ncbi:hypothetical protein O181_081236, partial [Austropuccinia psidii MF-1]|nr:hypothetical protein [Austropuccinia psidii MF-1]
SQASSRYVPYAPARNSPKPFVRCYYCSEEGHSTGRCNEHIKDQNKKWVIRKGFNYLYPNWARIPTDGKLSPKQLVREFQKEQEELKKKLQEKSKEEEQKKTEKSTAFITMDNWKDWKPPSISTGRETLGYSYGLRNTKQRTENEDKAKRQSQSLPKKEVNKPQETLKKKTSIPGGFIDDEHHEEEKVIIPTRYKSPRPSAIDKESEEPKEDREVLKPKNEDKEEVPIVEKVINKVLDQEINLTLEEIFPISPRFMNELKFVSDREKKYLMSLKSINNEEIVEDQEGNQKDIIIEERMHYVCPLGMIEVSIGSEGHKLKALVDTGAELSIIPEVESIRAGIPMRALNMRLKGIGGHSTAIVGLSENTLLIFPSGDEIKNHFFVARGEVHTVIGRPFLADNGIRIEHSQTQGEILSFRESDGRRLCIPICSPESKGWHAQPPKGMELCNMVKVDKMEVPDKNEESRLEEMNSEQHEISGLYEENILEVQEKQKKKEAKFGNIPNIKEYPSIKKGLEQKKESKAKILFKNISKKYGKKGTIWKKKQKDTISKEDHPSVPKMNKSPRIKVFISKVVSKIKRNQQDSVKWDFQCSGKGPTSEEELSKEEEINNQIKGQVNSITPEKEARQKEPEIKISEGLPSETQSEANINNDHMELNNMDLSEEIIEEEIKRKKKRDAMNFKLKIYNLGGKKPSEKALTENIIAENHHVGIDHSLRNFSTTYIRLGYETIPIMAILDETSPLNIIPIKMETEVCIGLKNTPMHVWKNHILRNRTAVNALVTLTAGENTYLKFSETRIDYVVLGQQFCDWFKMESRLSSSPQEEGKNKELRASRSGIEKYKGHNLEEGDKGYGSLDLEEYDKLLKIQYNMGYYYDKEREEETASRAKLDYVSGRIKETNCTKEPMEGTDSKWTENQSNKQEEATEGYQAFNLALSDYNEEENMEINDYSLFNQQIPEKEVNWEELIFGRNLEDKGKSVTRASSPALKENLYEKNDMNYPLDNNKPVNDNNISDEEILRQITEFLKETTNQEQDQIPQITQVTECPICSNKERLQKRKLKHKKQNNNSK